MKKIVVIMVLVTGSMAKLAAQDTDLMKLIDEDSTVKKQRNYTTATFKTSRLINGHSIENAAAGVMDVKISHRFGFINKGGYELFGLDQATMRIGLDYGISNRLMVGFGRSTFQKQYDGFAKFKLFRQSKGGSPVTVTAVSTIMYKTLKWEDPTRENFASSRFSYAHQLLIGRKFSDALSLQLMPSVVHNNLAPTTREPNDIYALGVGGRIKLTKRLSFNAEYYYVLPVANAEEGKAYRLDGTHNSLAIGFDIETGGHVFQLHFTNSTGMTEKTFITETTGDFTKGDIHFGFNVSRVFTIKEKKNRNKQKKQVEE
jgi:hypothetical protein